MADDADVAARVIERLLADPGFRADFRRDPATACSDAGLDELAEYMAYGAGKAMHTLDIRESRSSLAGVMMAAALEGVGVFEFAKHIVPGAIAAPGAVRDVLSRVNLPAVDGVLAQRGALAGTPAAPAAAGADDAATDPAAPGAAPAAGAVAAAPSPASAAEPEAAPGADDGTEPEAAPGAAGGGGEPAGAAEPSARAAATDAAAQSEAAPGDAPAEPPGSSAPVDPAQFGAEGSGGAPSPETLALLENKNVVFDKDGVADLKAGRIDPRVVAVLTKLSEDHKITVSCMCSDHPTFTTAGSVSNHHHGRGVDIAAIDGVPVNAANPMAREVATELSGLDQSYRPNEIGTPWAISGPGYFTDADHTDHLHVGFKQAIEPGWKAPSGQASAGAGERADAPAADAPAVAVAGAPAAATGLDTMSIAVPAPAGAGQASNRSLVIAVPAGAGAAAAPVAPAPQAAPAGAVAEQLAAGGGGNRGAGPKALAALAEATKYKGTPYLWGGSNPETGFDCSGLMQWAYAKQGIQTGRTTYDQIASPNGTRVDRDDLVPGDLVFFQSPSGDVHHVGMSMGGDKFLHAPRTGDVVKESSLNEPYYAGQFAGGRRFDDSPPEAAAAAPAPSDVDAAGAALARDAAAARSPDSMIFKALSKQEASHHNSTVQFMRAVRPDEGRDMVAVAAAAPVDPVPAPVAGSLEYPGNDASQAELAAWLAAHAQKAGLPPELPVMAALVESGVKNLSGGHADSVGFFQMRVGIWNKGEYAGYPERPELQAKWFVDHALAHKKARIAAGDADFGKDPSTWGNWIADVERPAAQYRGRYQQRLEEARGLLRRTG